MNPLDKKIQDLEIKVDELNQEILSLRNPSQVHPDIKKALSGSLALSNKNADSEDRTVNEAGSSSYAVLEDPVGFLQVNISGTLYYIPYYNA